MVASQLLRCSGQPIVGATCSHHDQLAVALKGEGIIVYDTRTQKPVRTWALGLPDQHLSGSPAYDRASQRYFAAVQPASDGSSTSTLLSWGRKAEGGSLKQAAQRAQLPAAVRSLHPLPAGPRSSEAHPMDVDGAFDDRPLLFAVYANGAVATCGLSGVLSENVEARGQEPLAADCTPDGSLTVVHADRSGGGASCSSFHIQGAKVECRLVSRLAPPEAGSRAVAAVAASGRAAVLWSNGAVAVYNTGDMASAEAGSGSGSSSPLQPQVCRRLRGFQLASHSAVPQNGKLGRGGKKRAHGGGGGGGGGGEGSGPVSLSALGDGLLAVVGWSSEAAGATALRLVVLDSSYGCIQAAADLLASDLGAMNLDPSQPVQAVALSGGSQLAIVSGGCVVLAELQLRPPTLANLIGALCLEDAAATGSPSDAAADSGSSNPCARAAAAALHESELALLAGGPGAAPGGSSSAPAPVHYSLEPEQAEAGSSSAASQLLVPSTVRWSEPNAAAMQQAERSAWSALLDSAGGKRGGSLLAAAAALVQASQQQGVAVSQRLLCRMLQAAAERQQWDCVSELLAAQHPGSLAACPGLAPALAEGYQYPLLQLLLSQATDVPADELAATLKCLLRKSPGPEAQQAQRAYLEGARAAAEAAMAAAEAASSSGSPLGELLAVAACAAGAVEGFSAAQACLHPLVAARHDGGVLLAALRLLSASEAVALLRYLRCLLRNLATLVGDNWRPAGALPAATVLPHPQLAVEWAGAAMDANMTRLVLRAEAAQVLSDIRQLVDSQLRALQRLSHVKGALQHANSGCALPAPHSTAAATYTLEWLDLRIG